MVYTQHVERSHRFRLALRIGIPVFFLIIVTFVGFLLYHGGTLRAFIALSLILLGVIVYFIFHLIYQGSRERITEEVSHTFLPEYFFALFDRMRGEKTLIMITLEKIWMINERYGIQNGDKVLENAALKIATFFGAKGFERLPLCRYKGGDFLLLFPGTKESYQSLVELFLAKYQNYTDEEIEVRLGVVMVDSRLSDEATLLINRLYDLRSSHDDTDESDPYSISELEQEILDALLNRRFAFGFWALHGEEALFDTTLKLIDSRGKWIHQNRYINVLNRLNKLRTLEGGLLAHLASLCDDSPRSFIASISATSLRNPYFYDLAQEILQRHPKAVGKLILLFDEKEYYYQIDRFAQQLHRYRLLGYRLALDHLGGNHTTMLYLNELTIDLIRFDPIFVRHIHDEGYQNILQGLNLTAHLCGVKTWLPKVEEHFTHTLALKLGIDYQHGNYFGKTLNLNDIQEMIQ